MASNPKFNPDSSRLLANNDHALCLLRPTGVVFDFKQSSFKKLSKLVDRLEKDKVLTQKVIRKQDNITAVNRQHPRLQALGEEEVGEGGHSGTQAGRVGLERKCE